MKNNFFLLILLLAFTIQAQVGINEQAPKVSLHISNQQAVNNDQAVGMLFPRLAASELATAVGNEYDGVMVYVTEAAQNATGALREVTSRGYYYFNKSEDVWSRLGNVHRNVIEENDLIFAKISTATSHSLRYPPSNNANTVANNYITWNSIAGTPAASRLRIESDGSSLRFPKGHIFRITAMVSIISATKPGYVITRFESVSEQPLVVSSWGYLETTNEVYQDGGVAYATTVINTHNQEMVIRLNAPVYGHSVGNRNLILGGSEVQDDFYYTHLIVEEL